VDLQILGIGRNAHIAFNEPGSSFESRTRVVSGIQSPPESPKTAITMGIATILDSRKILLLVSGESKAKPLVNAVEGKITESVPASVLQRHPDVVVIADVAGASRLSKK
jgi:glucosamine-6-phosphate deaminase